MNSSPLKGHFLVLIFDSEERGSTFLQNFGKYLPNYPKDSILHNGNMTTSTLTLRKSKTSVCLFHL
jgi:hypothetical protein